MHLYVHVPFCARRCSYCDFAIAVRRQVPSEAFGAALLEEWAGWQEHPAWTLSPELDTIYFGGGTPSHIDPATIDLLLQRFRHDRGVSPGAEITLEANPDDVDGPRAAAWREAGVNRISLGAQSFDPAVLLWMHRTHDAGRITAAMEHLRGAGFEDISLDLIFGVPASLRRDWYSDLDRALELAPTHLSLYGLTVEPTTPLGKWTARGEAIALDDGRAADEYLGAHARLTRAGFVHYEVSNAARAGRRARHNSAYWSRASFIGLGPAAHSGFGTTRRWNVRDWEAYRRLIDEGRSVMLEEETLSPEQVALEDLYLGLRTTNGLAAAQLPSASIEQWKESGWAREAQGRIILTPDGWLRLDALVASLSRC